MPRLDVQSVFTSCGYRALTVQRTFFFASKFYSRMSNGEIIYFTALDPDIQKLIRESVEAREYAYAPYSKFKVGAAILCSDGTISKGCNVENASFPAAVCAETTAIVKAVSEGKKKFKALAVTADHDELTFTAPCGICRQVLTEFGDMPVYLARSDMKSVLRTTVSNLVPLTFTLNKACPSQ